MRQPLVDRSDTAVSELAARIRGERWGRVSALYGMLLHHPPIAEGWMGLGSAIRRRTDLDDRTRELAICLVAAVCDQSFEWENHARLAEAAGVTPSELGALRERDRCATFSPRERLVLDLAEAVARGTVTDELFRRGQALLTPREMVEVVATAAYYVATARFLSAFGIEAGAPSLIGPEEGPAP